MGVCKDPAAPIDGSVQCDSVDHLHRRCTVTCDSNKAFLRPVPKFYSCGPIGVWNTNSPMNRFKFPPCGRKLICIDMAHCLVKVFVTAIFFSIIYLYNLKLNEYPVVK